MKLVTIQKHLTYRRKILILKYWDEIATICFSSELSSFLLSTSGCKHWWWRPKKESRSYLVFKKTRIGVDLVDEMVRTYTHRKQTHPLHLNIFFSFLDFAALNAYFMFRQNNPGCWSNRFLKFLSNSLILLT